MGGANPRASVLMPPSSIFTVPKRAAPPVREPLPVAARWARLGGRSPLRRTIPLARPQRPPPVGDSARRRVPRLARESGRVDADGLGRLVKPP